MNNRSLKSLSLRNPLCTLSSPRKSWALSAISLGVAVAVSGCGSSGGEETASSSPSSSAASTTSQTSDPKPSDDVTATTAPSAEASTAAPTAGTAPSGGPDACAAAEMAGEIEDTAGGGAAGSVYRTLVLTNVSSDACTLAAGFPGVSYIDASGEQIGAAAVRSGAGPAAGESFVLESGQSVAAELKETRAENYGQECESHQATELMVYPPEDLESLRIEHAVLACENPNVELMSIGALQKR
ncbi:hypothetical protein ABIB35_001930 [Arthrobacter sp. UYP6]|uniref:DUF4232 domain-containing protein n=1 Tax=Arthrobacter sp. UYP6 TaxID=1756378 RepID=UPI0033990F1B